MRRRQKKSSNWSRIVTSIHHKSSMSHEQTGRQLEVVHTFCLTLQHEINISTCPCKTKGGSVTIDNHLVAHEQNMLPTVEPSLIQRGLLYLGLFISIRTVYGIGQSAIAICRRVSLKSFFADIEVHFIHSFSSLSNDRSQASSKTIPPHSAI